MIPFLLVIVLVVGVVCLVLAVRSTLRERSFHKYAELHDAVITGHRKNEEGRYLTLYRIDIDGREIHGVFPDSSAEPVIRVGDSIPLYVRPEDPTSVMPAVSQTQTTVRFFNYLIGTVMVVTAVPLLMLVLF
ncbi:hypothetical protein HMPREF0290_1313 [Corynebacterium efficiens YS-314]|uniref:DUF3592 domain-containing protein n=1 Tax=Corynebacterium efficiens (strain DSM 44549 / YS-314 / AJ 12310 / JCM 11189 / NBRC 100395) TaxID=196164 RepID=Q8FQH1_COREF|nr:DUF3592 domain-containing protein [Corynebacterium efficiens]EEW50079.1 hypothetical protein HMPREF0290_1313 [Corynebacterium efficiens YS-314]BAC17958.1 hypothetical protein [Corynebacterium efficiens YS-314]